jgi:RNA polymerase sigma factor (sigma-70 family)
MYRYLDEIAARKRLSSSEEYRLAVRVRQGDEQARRSLIEHHLGLVVLLARPYSRRGLPMLDLIAEGNIGLLRAIEKFDPERGCRFSTYAKWWIRQSIELALMSQAGTVRVPVYVARALKQQAKANASGSRARASSVPCAEGSRARASSAPCAEGSRAGASSQCAQEPSSDESLPGAGQFLLHDIREARSARTARHDEPRSLVERLAAPEHEQPDWHLHLAAREKSLETAMLRLKPSEQRVLRARFGLAGEADCTLQSLADELNLSSERVRQIQSEALAKLRRILESEYGVGSDVLL